MFPATTAVTAAKNVAHRMIFGSFYLGIQVLLGLVTFSHGLSSIKPPFKMDSQRQRMRPWLEAKVNSGSIKGLQWIDKNQMIFRVPWKHGGKHDWNEEDSLIFKEWAIHTGRYREGVDASDYPTWKTRFRCALNKLPDIQEVKTFSKLDGPEPFRAYRFLTREDALKAETLYRLSNMDFFSRSELIEIKARMGENRMSFDLTDIPRPIEDKSSPLPDIVNNLPQGAMSTQHTFNLPNLPSDLNEINIEPFKSDSLNSIKQEPMDTEAADVQAYELRIQVRYCAKEVLDRTVRNPNGCRLYYGQQVEPPIPLLQQEASCHRFILFYGRGTSKIYGNPDADQIHFPSCKSPNNFAQERHTQDLLCAFERGLLIESHNGCVYVTRKSRCVIFISSPIENDGEPFKLERDKQVKVFDFFGYFDPKLQQYTYTGKESVKPKPYFQIGFGQKLQSAKSLENSNLLISGIVYHCKAAYRLSQVTCSPLSPPIEMSNSDEYDKLLRYAHDTQRHIALGRSPLAADPVESHPATLQLFNGFTDFQQRESCAMAE
ncbi:hypothetical protein FSP39_000565 [Pinctada imbricata]|uniref:IRF tryptophan pentad repeat domain-containing protein n=1 Tax=Pinctada imbricata TaxID=66713 RepID=A0AA89BRY1_PINIB|nr:hypothetical protein FSP39_000565 [Pinctada imbricata]